MVVILEKRNIRSASVFLVNILLGGLIFAYFFVLISSPPAEILCRPDPTHNETSLLKLEVTGPGGIQQNCSEVKFDK